MQPTQKDTKRTNYGKRNAQKMHRKRTKIAQKTRKKHAKKRAKNTKKRKKRENTKKREKKSRKHTRQMTKKNRPEATQTKNDLRHTCTHIDATSNVNNIGHAITQNGTAPDVEALKHPQLN